MKKMLLISTVLFLLASITYGQASAISGKGSRASLATVQDVKNTPDLQKPSGPSVTKTSTANANWNTASTWTPSGVPVAGDIVIINHNVAVNTAAVCNTLTINSGKTLTINSTRSVTVGTGGVTNNGSIVLTAGTSVTTTYLYTAGNFTNSGTGTLNGSALYTMLYFNGTTALTFTNNGTVTAPLACLTLGNSAGLTLLGSNQIVATRVSLYYGTITNSNKITLGNGGTTYGVVQVGANATYAAGTFDQPPTFYLGSGGIQILYAPALNNYSTSYEVPTDGVVAYFYVVCTPRTLSLTRDITIPYVYSTGLNLSTGNLSIGTHTLTIDGTIGSTSATLTGSAFSNIVFTGTPATTLPAVSGGLNNLTINNAAGITLGGAVTVNGTLALTNGLVNNGANLTMADGATIIRSAGSLTNAPTFAGTVNLTYSGASPINTGYEIPTSATALNNLTTNTGGVLQTSIPTGTVSTLYTQGFNGAPSDWATEIVTDPTGTAPAITYVTSATSTNPVVTPTEGTQCVQFNSYYCEAGDQIRLKQTTPNVTTGKINITVVFDWYMDLTYTNADNVTVQWSTNGTAWNNSSVYNRYSATNGWVTNNCVLPVGAENQPTLYIAFLFTGAYGNNCHLDNMKLKLTTPGIPIPTTCAVNGLFDLTSGSYSIGANNSLILNDGKAGSNVLIGGTTSNLTLGKNGAHFVLPAITDGLNNLTIHRVNGVTLNNALTVVNMVVEDGVKAAPLAGGNMTISGGLIVSGNLTISSGSVDITPGGALTVDGNLTNSGGSLLVESLGSLITNGTVTGNVTVERNITTDLAWHLLSSPVGYQPICNGGFAPTSSNFPGNIQTWDFYKWLPRSNNLYCQWENLRAANGTLNTVDFGITPSFDVTRGYAVAYGPGWVSPLSFYGTPNTGDQTCSFPGIVAGCPWDLAGNPFPSAINWNYPTLDKSNLCDDYYYVWNQNKIGTNGAGGYEYWSTDLLNSNPLIGPAVVNGNIPSMQGFFVCVETSGGKTLGLPNLARVHDNSTNWWLKETPANKLSIKLGNGTTYDEAFVMFLDNSNVGKDRNDAGKMFSMSTSIPQVYTIVDNNQKTALNAMPYTANGTTIPVGIVAPAEGNYSITVSGIESFGSLTGLSLEDLKLNYTQNLLQNPVYNFTAAGKEDAGRFLLHFAGSIGIGEKSNSTINIYSNEKTVFISCAAGFRNAQVTISNLLGQEILTQKLNDQTSNQVKVNALKGYYIVKVQDESSVKTAKVYIN